MRRWTMAAVLFAGVVLMGVACGESDADNGAAGGDTPQPATPGARRIEPAPIDEVEILIRESFPPQYAARIVSGLPNGCAEFHEAKVTSRSAASVDVEVTNTMPSDPDIACTQVYGQKETVVELGTGADFASGTEVTVRVNDTEAKFTAQ